MITFVLSFISIFIRAGKTERYKQALIYLDAYSEIYSKKDIKTLKKFIKNTKNYEVKIGNIEITNKTLLLSTCGPNGNTDRIILILSMEER